MRKPKIPRKPKEGEGLNSGQKLMLEDGVPRFLLVTEADAARRAQAWIDRPPRAMPAEFGGYSRYRDPETERLARLAEIDKANVSAVKAQEFFATKKARAPKVEFGDGLYVTSFVNKRAKGTKVWDRIMALEAYLKKNPGAMVADILRDTPYRKDDYLCDFNKGHMKVDVSKPKGKKK